MGKTRKPKPYTRIDAMKQRCRMMDDTDFMSDKEIKERKCKIAAIMYMVNSDLIKQEKNEAHRGYCPKCHCLRTTTGKCMSGCDEY